MIGVPNRFAGRIGGFIGVGIPLVGNPAALGGGAPRPEITQLNFTSIDGASLANPGSDGASLVISGATERYGVWFQSTDENQPGLSAYGVTEYLMVEVGILPDASVAAAARDALVNTGAFTAEIDGAIITMTDEVVGTRVDAEDVNSGAAITIVQQGRGTPSDPLAGIPFTTLLTKDLGKYQDVALTTSAGEGDPLKGWKDETTESGLAFTLEASAAVIDDGLPTFDGTTGLNLAHASAAALNTMQDDSYTLVFALKVANVTGGTYQGFFTKNAGGSNRMFFMLFEKRFWRYIDAVSYSRLTAGDVGNTAYVVSYRFTKTGTNTGTEEMRVNGIALARRTGSVPAVDTTNPWVIGNWPAAGGLFGSMGFVSASPSALSDADLLRVENVAAETVGATVQTASPIGQIVGQGDSIMDGSFASDAAHSFFGLLTADFGGDSYNCGVGGRTMAQIITDMPTVGLPPLNLMGANIVVLEAGTNDIESLAETAAGLYAKAQSYCAFAKGLGWQVILGQIIPRDSFDATKETHRTDYNQMLVDGIGVDADAVALVGGLVIPRADGTHPENAGHATMATAYITALNALP